MTQGSSADRELLSLLGDEHVQTMLVATSRRPMSVRKLADQVGVSVTTIYRRIEDLMDMDLLAENLELDADGNHYCTYETDFESMNVTLEDGEFDVKLAQSENTAERFTHIWDGMGGREE